MYKLLIMLKVVSQIISPIQAVITDLNDDNFHSEIEKHHMALVVFHTPWCGQCKKLMLRLPEIDKKLEENSLSVNIFKVDCETGGQAICDEYHLRGYPMIKSFRKGQEYGTFEGNREVEEIVNFVRIEASPASRKLEDFKHLENILREEDRVCLLANLRERSKLEVIFNALAEKFRSKISFLYSYINTGQPWVKLYNKPIMWNKFEEIFVEYTDVEDISKLENFIKKNYHGLVGLRTLSNKNEFSFPLVTAYYDVDYKMNPKGTSYWRNRILKVAVKYKDKFQFAISSKNEFSDELHGFGMDSKPGEKPVVVVVLESNERFVLRENFSVDTFDVFLHNILHGKLNPYLKSQEVPKENDSDVIVAVGSTFYDLVIKNSNDVMVKLYAEWCGHCKKMAPAYKKVAYMLRNENITFVEVDAALNDVPVAYTPTGYPTIYWSTKDYRMSPIMYQGDRSIEDFIKFIAKHASNELKSYDRDGNLKAVKTEL